MSIRVFPDDAALATVCRQRQIWRLALFGSMLKGTARPDSELADPEVKVQLATHAI